ncbi:MAG: biotin transporter BioY [Ruminococcaceae bacterium]|nr:biotin transporter BioY [Oscillospiraceae bacterium]
MTKNKKRLLDVSMIGISAAVLCVVSPIAIPVGDVALSLATLVILVSAGVIGAWKSTAAVLVYLVLGGVGLPVFSGFTGGAGRLLGPTGGFLFGYLLLSLVSGLGRSRIVTMILGNALLYVCGTVWYTVYADVPVITAAGACVLPYILPDALKIVAATAAVRRIKKIKT